MRKVGPRRYHYGFAVAQIRRWSGLPGAIHLVMSVMPMDHEWVVKKVIKMGPKPACQPTNFHCLLHCTPFFQSQLICKYWTGYNIVAKQLCHHFFLQHGKVERKKKKFWLDNCHRHDKTNGLVFCFTFDFDGCCTVHKKALQHSTSCRTF